MPYNNDLIFPSLDIRYDAFLTHAWGDDIGKHHNHERVAKINEELKKRGVITWFDGEKMKGSFIIKRVHDALTYLTK